VLEITQRAAEAINQLAPGESGLRVFISGGPPDIQSLQVEVAEAPQPADQVVETEGAQVFLEPQAAETLDDKVLDATQDERGVRFAIAHQA
jgi:Fe-S cluster assembly iron-binding protein IscA